VLVGKEATLELLGRMLEELGCAEAAEIVRDAQGDSRIELYNFCRC